MPWRGPEAGDTPHYYYFQRQDLNKEIVPLISKIDLDGTGLVAGLSLFKMNAAATEGALLRRISDRKTSENLAVLPYLEAYQNDSRSIP